MLEVEKWLISFKYSKYKQGVTSNNIVSSKYLTRGIATGL